MQVNLGDHVYLLGKGPSLDSFKKENKIKDKIIGINETVFILPCYAAVALDYDVLDKYLKDESKIQDTIILRKNSHIKYPFKNMYIWHKHKEVSNLFSTAVVALQLIKYFGCNKITMVGFDSVDGNLDYANQVKFIKAEGNSNQYKAISLKLFEMISTLGLNVDWWHRLCKR